jgi:hypothetical protein
MKGERKAGGVRALLLPVRRLALVTGMQVGQRRPGGGVAIRSIATGMALDSGLIARSKTGEHDPPFRGQCRSTIRALPHATEMAQPADGD